MTAIGSRANLAFLKKETEAAHWMAFDWNEIVIITINSDDFICSSEFQMNPASSLRMIYTA